MKLDAKKLRLSSPSAAEKEQISKNPLYIIVDNVLDTYNIGSIFRLADGVAATKVYLCHGSETPPHHRIKKASINTTEWVDWEYTETATQAITKLREEVRGVQVMAIEQTEQSIPYDKFDFHLPVALVVGHETDGVSQETLKECDGVVELPMFGVNTSLNVVVSLGIMLYQVIEHTKLSSSN